MFSGKIVATVFCCGAAGDEEDEERRPREVA